MPPRHRQRQALPPNAPAHVSRDWPLSYTSFHPPPFVNAKNVSSSYLKSEAQTWMSRSNAPLATPQKRSNSEEPEDVRAHANEDKDAQHRIVIHMGSRYLRIGRATDLYPTVVPCVIARNMRRLRALRPRFERPQVVHAQTQTNGEKALGDMQGDAASASKTGVPVAAQSAVETGPNENAAPGAADATAQPNAQPNAQPDAAGAAQPSDGDTLSQQIERIRAELRLIMQQYKLRAMPNAQQSSANYNASVTPQRVPEHDDVHNEGWVEVDAEGRVMRDGKEVEVLVGNEALRLAPLSPDGEASTDWELFRPFSGGLLNVEQYVAAYGESSAVSALLGDLETIITYAITAPADTDGSLASPGLGIALGTIPQHAVLIVVPDSFSRSDIRTLGTVLLSHMRFAAINVQTEGLCALYGAGISAACVVDIGASCIGISCVEEGLVLPETRVALTYGGNDMSRFLGEVLMRSNFPYREIDAEKRLCDAALLDSLKERLVTLQPSQVGTNLYDFNVRRPKHATFKYMLSVYDASILAGLLLFHPEVVPRSKPVPRRPLTALSPAALRADEPVEKDSSGGALLTNPSLGGDEGAELSSSSLNDIAATMAMHGCVGDRLPLAVAQSLGLRQVPVTPNPEQSTTQPTATPVPPSYASLALRSATAAVQAAQEGFDVLTESGRTPLDQAVFRSLLASTGSIDGSLGAGNEERLRRLANNILCIGGSANLPGLSEALEARVAQLMAQHYVPTDGRAPAVSVAPGFVVPEVAVIPPPRNMEPDMLPWKGLAALVHLDSMQELWVRACDWETFGYRALKEKTLFL
ncbi:actin-like protein arp8 [Malassezia cuniculi]|uniref:Actin-like protein arp8 n=1 Tax=Malassezia cuniculi TaxID=948313 RepID=A0AAF0EZ64_9BASI|nr:actin-like protein arp8 [Malassezia cuniculi]